MIVKALVENTSISKKLKCEHGLSIYIETKLHKILFDLGPGRLFIENARKMNIDLSEVDTVIISHGHNDHGGGLKLFLEHNKKAKIYINEHAFESYYYKVLIFRIYIGLEPALCNSNRIIFTNGTYQIDEELQLFSDISEQRYCPPSNKRLLHKVNGRFVQDKFHHEQNLLIKEKDSYTLFAGCAHNGIINILRKAEAITGTIMENTISGFHLYQMPTSKKESIAFLKDLSGVLKERPTIYYTCHCTGLKQYQILRKEMGEQMKYLSTGMELELKPMIIENPAYDNEYCIAYDCPDWKATYLKWRKFCSGENFRHPLDYILTILQTNQDLNAIFDNTEGIEAIEEDIKWVSTEYISRIEQTNCKNIIIVVGTEPAYNIDPFIIELRKHFTVHKCKSIVEAEQYLVY